MTEMTIGCTLFVLTRTNDYLFVIYFSVLRKCIQEIMEKKMFHSQFKF